MDFELTTDQKMLQKMVRDLAVKEFEPTAAEIDKSGEFPPESVKKLAKQGLMGTVIPEQYGGSEFDSISLAIAVEELSKVSASFGLMLTVHNSFVAYPIIKYGTEEQKKRWLPKLAEGTVGAFAFTEEGADFSNILIDKRPLKTSVTCPALAVDGKKTISGEKTFVVNGEYAGLFLVFANTPEGVTAFILEKGDNLGEPFVLTKEKILGVRTGGICSLKLNEVRFEKDNILGGEGKGFQIVSDIINSGNIGLSATLLGIGESAITEAIKYSKERQQFGETISKFSLIRNTIVEMRMRLNAVRLLLWDSACKNGSGMSGIAKLQAGEAVSFITTKAIQIHGGYGYTNDYPVERYFRDAKVVQVFGGSPEFQRHSLASQILGEN